MEGFKCALGKLLASRPCGTPGQQESIYCRLELLSSNYPRPSNYSGTVSTSYSSPGPGMTNSLGMNASSPMHGQGPGQPIPVGRNHGPGNQNRVYPPMAPSSPSMPQPAGPGMGPPLLGSSNRKSQEAAAGMQGSANSTHNRRSPYIRSPVQMQPPQPASAHWPAPHPSTCPPPSPPPRPHHPSILPPSHSQHHRSHFRTSEGDQEKIGLRKPAVKGSSAPFALQISAQHSSEDRIGFANDFPALPATLYKKFPEL
ncbi:hypothetical protein INR49_002966 [Caranx melampygus]|nr:hypothetical protein INR49_002966 [Caranx melampygus]